MFNPDGTARPAQVLQAGITRAAGEALNGKMTYAPAIFSLTITTVRRAQELIERASRFLPTHHKSVWGKWKKRRKLAKRERKKEKNGPVIQKPHREDGDAAYKYDEYDDLHSYR